MLFIDSRSDDLLVESSKEGLNSVAELIENRPRNLQSESQPFEGACFLRDPPDTGWAVAARFGARTEPT